MKNLFICFAMLQFICTVAQNNTQFNIAQEQIDRLISENISTGVSGAIAMDGQIIWNASAGWANQESKTPFTTETLTRIASIAKPMTAIAVLQLFEQGRVDLEAPIQVYVPDFPVKKEGEITVRHLLNHSAGIKAYQSNKEMANTIHYETITEAMNYFKEWDLLGTPGVEERYTTYGYVILGVLIERVSGMSYEAYMQENIWDKAGMTHTGIEDSRKTYNNKSSLYQRKRNGKIKAGKKIHDLSNRTPGGGFYSNVPDVLKFGQAVLDYTLISEETTQIMVAQQEVGYEGNPYALGWFLYQTGDKGPEVMGHSGTQQGCTAQLMLVRELDMVVVILTNTSGGWGDVIGASIRLIEDGIRYEKEKLNLGE